MTVVYITFGVLTFLVAICTYLSTAHYLVKGLMIIVLVLFGFFTEVHYRDSLGAPIEGFPEGKFRYTYHEVQGDFILLWVWTEGKDDRLYNFPFDQETAEELAKAQQEGQEGATQGGEFITDQNQEGELDTSLFMDDWVGPLTDETKG